MHLFHLHGERGGAFSCVELEPVGELLFGLIGGDKDMRKRVREDILGDANKMHHHVGVNNALDIACTRAMRREISNPKNEGVGGHIQAAIQNETGAAYAGVQTENATSFRGAKLHGPGAMFRCGQVLEFDQSKYNPDVPLDNVIAEWNNQS